jgi:hypothetical protein
MPPTRPIPGAPHNSREYGLYSETHRTRHTQSKSTPNIPHHSTNLNEPDSTTGAAVPELPKIAKMNERTLLIAAFTT